METTDPDPESLDNVSFTPDNFVDNLVPAPFNNKNNNNASVCTISNNDTTYNSVPENGAIRTPDLDIFHSDTLTPFIQQVRDSSIHLKRHHVKNLI